MWDAVPALRHPPCVTLGKSESFSELQFPLGQQRNERVSPPSTVRLDMSRESAHSAQCQVQEAPVTVSSYSAGPWRFLQGHYC